MANKHYKRWWFQMPVGFLFISTGILAIVYFLDKRPDNEWPVWAVISVVIFDIGLGFLGSAFVHKVKSDLIRKERIKHQHPLEEEF
ncbi:MAG: hypothetical protein ACHQF0_14020 [Chitinophagales bacterium]